MRFISEPIVPAQGTFDPALAAGGAPALPSSFRWRDQQLVVARLTRTWKTSKLDRGDAYVDRHWFEFDTPAGGSATVYFDRHARGKQPRWWLYTLSS